MDILGQDVDMLKELIVDAIVTTLLVAATDRIELIERVDRNVLERNLTLLMTLHQLAVEAQWCATCGKSQYEWRQLLVNISYRSVFGVRMHHTTYHIGNILHSVILTLKDTRCHTLIAMDNISWCEILYKTTILRELILTIVHNL